MPKKNRFKVIEHFNGFEIMDRTTKKTAWLGDGVDAITTPTGKSVSPGTKGFTYRWERMFNENPEQTAEAYFPQPSIFFAIGPYCWGKGPDKETAVAQCKKNWPHREGRFRPKGIYIYETKDPNAYVHQVDGAFIAAKNMTKIIQVAQHPKTR